MAFNEPELIDGAALFDRAWREGWRRDPEMGIGDWAETYMSLPQETSAERGQYRISRTPYVQKVFEDLSPGSPFSNVVLQWGAQTAKSTVGLCWVGFTLHLNPGPMMLVQPTLDLAKNFSKERITTLINNTPVLRARVLKNKSRDDKNTQLRKAVLGGFLKMSGANSAVSLRSTPIRDLFCDEIDGWPLDVDGEGSPIGLVAKRTLTFSRGRKLWTSTPKHKGDSPIERMFLKSNQCRYFVPCPHCGELDWIRWSRIDFRDKDPETVMLRCDACGALTEEGQKTWMLDPANGAKWIAQAPGDGHTAGFHLSGLYSPLGWYSWKTAVADWLEAQQDLSLLKGFINTVLAETYEDRNESVDPGAIMGRREQYAAEVPDGVGVLVAGVDVQKDRLEYQVKGFGGGEESWLIDWGTIVGDRCRTRSGAISTSA